MVVLGRWGFVFGPLNSSSMLLKNKAERSKSRFLIHAIELERCPRMHWELWLKNHPSASEVIPKTCSTFRWLGPFSHNPWPRGYLDGYHWSVTLRLWLDSEHKVLEIQEVDNKQIQLKCWCTVVLLQCVSECEGV